MHRRTTQEVRPWNVSFAQALPEGSAFAARELFLDAGSRNGTRTLAREILMMDAADYVTAFKGSAIKRAKFWMLQRNACVVLGNVGTSSKHRERRAEHDASTHLHPNDEPERSAAVAHGTYEASLRDLPVALVKLQRHLIQC